MSKKRSFCFLSVVAVLLSFIGRIGKRPAEGAPGVPSASVKIPDETEASAEDYSPFSTRDLRMRRIGVVYGWFVTIIIFVFLGLLLYTFYSVYQVERAAKEPFCVGFECRSKNPDGTNCQSKAQNLKQIEINDANAKGTLTLKFSRFCMANWVKWEGKAEKNGDGKPLVELGGPLIWVKSERSSKIGVPEQFKGKASLSPMWSGMIQSDGDTCVALQYRLRGESEWKLIHDKDRDCTRDLPG